jgi:nucleoside-diphosphate-sugar epimerase
MAELYLITGGAGFIGSNLGEEVLRQGGRLRVFDDFSTGFRENVELLRELGGDRVEVAEGDLRNYQQVRDAMQGVSYVSHQAALRSVERSVDDPLSSNLVNVDGTLHVLAAAREAGVRRVVYASSSSVYGDGQELPKHEKLTPSPVSPYAVSKLAAEHYCRVFSKLYGVETVSLRYFNVFGPRQSPKSQYAAVVPLFMRAALAGEPLEIHGDGKQSRDFTYIDNVVQANWRGFHTPGVAGEAFNVACGERHDLLEIADLIASFVGRDLERRHSERRRGDVMHTEASIDKIQSMMGYQPTVGFADGMRRTFDALRESLAAA